MTTATARAIVSSLEQLEARRLLAAGDLDLLFGGGAVIRDVLGGNDYGFAVAVQSDGKVLVAGRAYTGATMGNDFAIARFNGDGTPDLSFGTGGVATTHLGSASDGAYAIIVQADGRILAAGETSPNGSSSDFALVRYTADGSLDASFGDGGITVTDFAGGSDQARGMALAPGGRIIVAGWATIGGMPQFALAGYSSGGVLDPGFGDAGTTTTSFADGYSRASSVVVLSDGSIVAAGDVYGFSGDGSDLAAVRYLADGQLDTSFSASGWALVDLPGETDESAAAVAVQADGSIILAGSYFSWDTDREDFVLARLLPGGALDSSFGSEGFILSDFAGGADRATALALQADGKIVAAGPASIAGTTRFGLARFNADGSADSTFADSGKATIAIASAAVANALAIDDRGQLTAGGFAENASGGYDFAAARVVGRMNLPPIANPGSAYSVAAGASIRLDGAASLDPDGQIVSYEWDFDYDGASFDADGAGVSPTFSAAGLSDTVKTVALRVTDNDGAAHIATTTVTVSALPPLPPPAPPDPQPEPAPLPKPVSLQADPANPGRKILIVNGTPRGDAIYLKSIKGGLVEVRLNGRKLGRFAKISRIAAYGNAGHDLIDAHCANVPVDLFGGDGNDRLHGTPLNDLLAGGDGNDRIWGNKGDDLIIGGRGADHLHSVFGNDMLIGGSLRFDGDIVALRSLARSFNLASGSVIDDNTRDDLYGTPGADVLAAGAKDKIHKIKARRGSCT